MLAGAQGAPQISKLTGTATRRKGRQRGHGDKMTLPLSVEKLRQWRQHILDCTKSQLITFSGEQRACLYAANWFDNTRDTARLPASTKLIMGCRSCSNMTPAAATCNNYPRDRCHDRISRLDLESTYWFRLSLLIYFRPHSRNVSK